MYYFLYSWFALIQLKQSGYDEKDLKAKLKDAEDFPKFPCKNQEGYDKCMSGVMNEWDDAVWTFTGATIGFMGAAIGTEGISLFLTSGAYGIAIRQMSNAMDKRNKGMGDCYNTYCGEGGSGSGLPPGGFPKPKYAK